MSLKFSLQNETANDFLRLTDTLSSAEIKHMTFEPRTAPDAIK